MGADSQQGNRRERKKERTRESIISIALELFRKQGYESTAMEQIAEEADISKATLYKYFSNKEAIVAGYLSDSVRDNEQELSRIISEEPDTRSRLMALLLKLFQWNEQNRDIVRMHTSMRIKDLVEFRDSPDRHSNFYSVLYRIVETGQDAGEIRGDIPAGVLALYLKTMYLVPFIQWLAGCDRLSHEKGIAELIEIFLGGAQSR